MQERYALWAIGVKPPTSRRTTGYDSFIAALEKETLEAFGKPVVYVHGDTHIFRIDKPLVGHQSQRIIENFTRVATFGHPDTHWIRATIDPSDPNGIPVQTGDCESKSGKPLRSRARIAARGAA